CQCQTTRGTVVEQKRNCLLCFGRSLFVCQVACCAQECKHQHCEQIRPRFLPFRVFCTTHFRMDYRLQNKLPSSHGQTTVLTVSRDCYSCILNEWYYFVELQGE